MNFSFIALDRIVAEDRAANDPAYRAELRRNADMNYGLKKKLTALQVRKAEIEQAIGK